VANQLLGHERQKRETTDVRRVRSVSGEVVIVFIIINIFCIFFKNPTRVNVCVQSQLYAATHCHKVGDATVFHDCLRTVDWKVYRAWCIKDACASPVSQSVCTMISALAFSCAIRGVYVDWMADDTLAQFCRGGLI